MYEVFEQLCKERGVTAYQVAKATKIPSSSFSSWKTGKYSPKQDKLKKIADYFEVPLEYLTTGEIKEGYYLSHETAKIAQQIYEDKDMKLLFDAAADSRPEDLRTVAEILKRLKETNPEG